MLLRIVTSQARQLVPGANWSKRRKARRLEDVGDRLDGDPVKLDVLADGQVGDAAGVSLGQVGDRPQLVRQQQPVRDPDAHHEVWDGVPLATLAADSAEAVALGVDAPPPEVGLEPGFGNRRVALAREAHDVVPGLPGVERALEPLDALGLRLPDGLAHAAAPAGGRPSMATRMMESANGGNGSNPSTAGAWATKFDVALTS